MFLPIWPSNSSSRNVSKCTYICKTILIANIVYNRREREREREGRRERGREKERERERMGINNLNVPK
jgi:hypothetical protein